MDSVEPTKRNIEIKARIANEEEFSKRVNIAKKLTDTEGEIIPQHDVFFNVTNGRLKLRYLQVCMQRHHKIKAIELKFLFSLILER